MAKIVISHFSGIKVNGANQVAVFYEGLVNSLIKQGNDILHFITSDFLEKPWNGDNTLIPGLDKKKILATIQNFSPDLVISFNNSTLPDIEKTVDCPIVLWNADSFIYFSNKENIQRNPSRYTYFSFDTSGIDDYSNYLSIARNKIFRVKAATALQAERREIRHNISFIGSSFNLHDTLAIGLKNQPRIFKAIYEEYFAGNLEQVDLLLAQYNRENSSSIPISREVIRDSFSGPNRNQVISAIAPLGLGLYGSSQWTQILPFSLEAFMAYEQKAVYNLKDNQDIYNSSRLAINISHSQATTGFPWRIPDIMATNACLVTHPSTDFLAEFGHNIPFLYYNNPYEAYQVCKTLLSDESRRKEIVLASNDCIQKGFTWQVRLKEIEEILGISLTNLKKAGSYTQVRASDFYIPNIRRYLIQRKIKRTMHSMIIKGGYKCYMAIDSSDLIPEVVKKYLKNLAYRVRSLLIKHSG